MKKVISVLLLIIIFCFVFSTTCLANENQKIIIKGEIKENLTKIMTVSALTDFTIDWGDGVVETFAAGTNLEKSHTYSADGSTKVYQIVITGVDIENFKSMYSEITDIDFSGISTLKSINISGNKISNLTSLAKNKGLVELRCRNCSFLELDTEEFTNLEILDCANNYLSSLNIPTSIKELYIEGNSISVLDTDTTFDLSKYSLLEIANCSRNSIENIELSQNGNLKTLDCRINNIVSLDVSNNTNLVKLNCSNNNISELKVHTNLKKLITTGNSGINTLNLGSLDLLIVDNNVEISGASNTIIKVGVTGKGSLRINDDTIYLYPNINCEVNSIVLNGVPQDVNNYIDVSAYTGENILEINFTNEENETIINVNKPQVFDEMIPVKHNGNNWVITNEQDPEWYDYSKSNMKWANVMLRDGVKYLDYDGVTLIDITKNTELKNLIGREIPEDNTGSMYVWIPRFSYRIAEDSIDIKYSNGISDDTSDKYLVHPAFNYANYTGNTASNSSNYKNGLSNSDKLKGLWIAKYQATGTQFNPKYSSSGEEITNITIGDAFLASKINPLTDVKSHMMKNTEWGAVSYLTSAAGVLESNSTTGNIYGIYNMNNGGEFVSHYMELIGGISNYSVRKNGISLLPYSIVKFNHEGNELADIRDIDVLRLYNPYDNSENNYNSLSKIYGIGVNEVNINITGDILGEVPTSEKSFFVRGIYGMYSYIGTNGSKEDNFGFRNVLIPRLFTEKAEDESYYVISKCEGEGKVSPLGKTTVLKGNNVTFSIIPSEGYEILDVKLDDTSVLNDVVKCNSYSTYTITDINANHMLYVQFALKIEEYNVNATKNIEEAGNIIGIGPYYSRSIVTLTATENTGYKFINWEIISGIDELTSDTNKTISFKMPNANVELKANYEKIAKAKLTVINGNNTTEEYRTVGEEITINVVNVDGYNFGGWLVSGIEGLDTSKTTLEFIMPPCDVTIESTYYQLKYTISYNVNGGVGEIPDQIKKEKEDLILTEEVPERELYVFMGWATTYDAIEAEYQPKDIFSKDENTTLYAVWQSQKVKLTVETLSSKAYGEENCGAVVIIIAKPIEGYQFDSWTATGISLTDEQITQNAIAIQILEEDVTLIANYSSISDNCDHEWGSWKSKDLYVHIVTCTLCGYEKIEEHKISGEYEYNNVSHWKLCKDCGGQCEDSAGHNWENFDSSTDICQVCGAMQQASGTI